MSIFPKERKPHNNEKCWNIDGIIYIYNIRPASASKLCLKQPKYDHIFSDCFCQWLVEPAEEASTQPLWMEIRPSQPQHPVPAPSPRHSFFSKPMHRSWLHSSVIFMLFVQKMEGLNVLNLLPDSCPLSVALNCQVFILELFMLWPKTRAPLPQNQTGKDHSRFTRNLLNDGSALSVLLIEMSTPVQQIITLIIHPLILSSLLLSFRPVSFFVSSIASRPAAQSSPCFAILCNYSLASVTP